MEKKQSALEKASWCGVNWFQVCGAEVVVFQADEMRGLSDDFEVKANESQGYSIMRALFLQQTFVRRAKPVWRDREGRRRKAQRPGPVAFLVKVHGRFDAFPLMGGGWSKRRVVLMGVSSSGDLGCSICFPTADRR